VRVLDAQQMREAERRTIEDLGLPAIVLMENAGRQIVAAMESAFDVASMRVGVLCGRGNNGGDGFVVSRTLLERGVDVTTVLIGESSEVTGDARTALETLRALGADVIEIRDAGAWELHGAKILTSDLVVDAMLGTGFRAPVAGLYETIIADVNASPCPVVSVDLPSGLTADSPEPPGPVIDATMTVTMAAPKLSLVLPPGEVLAGNVVIADIGVPAAIVDDLEGPRVELLTKEALRGLVEPRAADSHKGDYGRVLIVAGSPGKTGAAALAANAALRSGAGLVTVASPARSAPVVAALGAEFMTLALPEDAEGFVTPEAADIVSSFGADVIAIGPGLGRTAGVRDFVRAIVEQAGVPLVLDADAILALAGNGPEPAAREGAEIILTPHPGEMAALTGMTIEEVQGQRLQVARELAVARKAHVVLKGHRTVVATPDGRAFINLTGNAGMATGGSGDVLTGAIAAWAGQLLDVEAACKLGVYLHGLAGDLAESDEGEVSLIAGDIISHMGEAILELTARRKKSASRD
jgi:NAD(P)H-hydrate epimerase